MYSLLKAAPAAALSLTLISAATYTDAGFAFGTEANMALEANTITVDPQILAEIDAARSVSRTDPLSKNSNEIVYSSGTGGFVPPAAPVADEDQAAVKDTIVNTEKLTAASLAALVSKHGGASDLSAEQRCLAGAVYFESKGESLPGQLAVARVVLARTKSGRFPASICGVVYQRSQFSFVRGGKMPRIDTGGAHWRNAVAISKIALDNSWKSPVEGALFFHARYVSPGWKLKRIGTIDNHVFYR
jgi:Cell Wall Hydrolase